MAEKKESWRFVRTEPLSPAMNMAIDEAILVQHSKGEVPPTVRFYTWEPSSLSIGYFQEVEKEVDMDQVRAHGLGFVRRPTGGRAVLHDTELTYSVVVSEQHPAFPPSVIESYQVISRGLMEGFRELGLNAEMVTVQPGKHQQSLKKPQSAVCFDTPSWYELVVEGKKVAGSAQTRQNGTILQHGAILLDMDVDLLFDVLRFPSEQVKQQLKSSFFNKAVAINQLLSEKIDVETASEAFFKGFSKGLGVTLEPESLTEEEWNLAQQLAETRYARDEWNFKR
ncbi:MAG: lipoate--protein ligase family protein [Bacillaceae bacterium]|nr:lipoate--protein ligase family protein [Bacillaceae bacterium]